jgi:hypothetical protein
VHKEIQFPDSSYIFQRLSATNKQYIHQHASNNKISYYLEFKTYLFSHFSELKIRERLSFEVLFFTLMKFGKHDFP